MQSIIRLHYEKYPKGFITSACLNSNTYGSSTRNEPNKL